MVPAKVRITVLKKTFNTEFVDAYTRRADAHEAMENAEAETLDDAVITEL